MFHSSSCPVTCAIVPRSRRAAFAHRGERLGEDLLEHLRDHHAQLALHAAAAVAAAQLVVDRRALVGVGGELLLLLERRDLTLEVGRALVHDAAQALRLLLQLVLGQAPQPLVLLVDRIDERLDALHFPLVAGPEDGGEHGLDHDVPLAVQSGVAG